MKKVRVIGAFDIEYDVEDGDIKNPKELLNDLLYVLRISTEGNFGKKIKLTSEGISIRQMEHKKKILWQNFKIGMGE